MEFTFPSMQVSDVMVKYIITVSSDDTVAKALSLMIENRVHQLPAVEENEYMGMVYAKHFIETNVLDRKSVV